MAGGPTVEPNAIVPTPPAGDASNRSASTAFVTAAIAAAVAGLPTVIPAGTVSLFFQAAAPTGWTQVVTQNDKALRLVSGIGGGTGGSTAFSTVFGQTTTGATTLSSSQVPVWTANAPSTHTINVQNDTPSVAVVDSVSAPTLNVAASAASSHTHTVSLLLQYADIILASKD